MPTAALHSVTYVRAVKSPMWHRDHHPRSCTSSPPMSTLGHWICCLAYKPFGGIFIRDNSSSSNHPSISLRSRLCVDHNLCTLIQFIPSAMDGTANDSSYLSLLTEGLSDHPVVEIISDPSSNAGPFLSQGLFLEHEDCRLNRWPLDTPLNTHGAQVKEEAGLFAS